MLIFVSVLFFSLILFAIVAAVQFVVDVVVHLLKIEHILVNFFLIFYYIAKLLVVYLFIVLMPFQQFSIYLYGLHFSFVFFFFFILSWYNRNKKNLHFLLCIASNRLTHSLAQQYINIQLHNRKLLFFSQCSK